MAGNSQSSPFSLRRRPSLTPPDRSEGAVAIRLNYRDTSFCFLTAHLAAGHSNFEERNADYFTIAEGLHFSRGKNIASHEYDPFRTWWAAGAC
jgi:hypothetical protein